MPTDDYTGVSPQRDLPDDKYLLLEKSIRAIRDLQPISSETSVGLNARYNKRSTSQLSSAPPTPRSQSSKSSTPKSHKNLTGLVAASSTVSCETTIIEMKALRDARKRLQAAEKALSNWLLKKPSKSQKETNSSKCAVKDNSMEKKQDQQNDAMIVTLEENVETARISVETAQTNLESARTARISLMQPSNATERLVLQINDRCIALYMQEHISGPMLQDIDAILSAFLKDTHTDSKKHLKLLQMLLNTLETHPRKQHFRGVLYMIAGFTLLAASAALCFFTSGAALPMAALGIHVGIGLIVAGVAAVAVAVAGIGVFAGYQGIKNRFFAHKAIEADLKKFVEASPDAADWLKDRPKGMIVK